jgi:uncharacterized protein (DUF4415 family)
MGAKRTKKERSKGLVATRPPISPELTAQLEAVARLPDSQIDTSDPDAPEVLDWTGAMRGRFYRPVKRQLTLRIDEDVIAFFKQETGERGYQTAMNRALREAMLRGLQRRQLRKGIRE